MKALSMIHIEFAKRSTASQIILIRIDFLCDFMHLISIWNDKLFYPTPNYSKIDAAATTHACEHRTDMAKPRRV
jgi:hypothetical protein